MRCFLCQPILRHKPITTSAVAIQRGFTLLEILVSFTLISIVLTMMYSGIRIVHRVSDKGEQQVDATSQIRTVHTFLRRQLNGLLPIDFSPQGDPSPILFSGEAEKMQFVAVMPGHLRQGGVYKQTIEYVDAGSESNVRFLFEPVHIADNRAHQTSPVVLLDAKSVRFQYLDAKEFEDDNVDSWQWSDTWDESGRIPALISIDVTFADDAKKKSFWPLFIVAPVRDGNK